MNLSARERRLVVVFGVVIVASLVVFVLGRLGGGDAVVVPEVVFPSSQPSAAVVVPTGSPTFVIPVGARDPFKG